MKTSKLQEPCGSGVGEATDQQPFSWPLESGAFSRPPCASCPASLALGDGHQACFRCLGTEHATVALVTPASCATCRALPVEGLLSRHLFFSPSVVLSEAIDIKAGDPDIEDNDDLIEVDDVASPDNVFADSASVFSYSWASTAMVVPR